MEEDHVGDSSDTGGNKNGDQDACEELDEQVIIKIIEIVN